MPSALPQLGIHARHWRVGAAAAFFLLVNAGGVLLVRAAEDPDAQLRGLDTRAVERPADARAFNREQLRSLFSVDVGQTVRDTGILASEGADIDAARVADILAGQLGDFDLVQGSALELSSKVSALRERMEVQSEVARRVSMSSFESAVMDAQTKKLEDKMQELTKVRDGMTKKWLDTLKASDTASSYLNNLPPL